MKCTIKIEGDEDKVRAFFLEAYRAWNNQRPKPDRDSHAGSDALYYWRILAAAKIITFNFPPTEDKEPRAG